MRTVVFVACLFLLDPVARAAECSSRDGYAAEVVTDYLDTWKDIANFRKQFQNCDDGGVAEGVSDAVAQILAKQWTRLPELIDLISKDLALEEFVIGHLDETDDSDDLDRIVELSHTQCPTSGTKLCEKFIARIKSLDKQP